MSRCLLLSERGHAYATLCAVATVSNCYGQPRDTPAAANPGTSQIGITKKRPPSNDAQLPSVPGVVIPGKMGIYDQVVRNYQLKRLKT